MRFLQTFVRKKAPTEKPSPFLLGRLPRRLAQGGPRKGPRDDAMLCNHAETCEQCAGRDVTATAKSARLRDSVAFLMARNREVLIENELLRRQNASYRSVMRSYRAQVGMF